MKWLWKQHYGYPAPANWRKKAKKRTEQHFLKQKENEAIRQDALGEFAYPNTKARFDMEEEERLFQERAKKREKNRKLRERVKENKEKISKIKREALS